MNKKELLNLTKDNLVSEYMDLNKKYNALEKEFNDLNTNITILLCANFKNSFKLVNQKIIICSV